MSDSDVRWIVTNAPRATAEQYAYATMAVVRSDPGQGYGPVTIAVVTGRVGQGDAQYLADYQADRLRSGLYVARVVESYAEAYNAAAEALEGERL